ncbi:hypothetical protein N7457_006344 [Penicillium paradoxum]|uniref:uncharacterized protein n=1 Tax=Penicillium paradoxum TaxID=176176 RepID=UPI0025487136|nr:uncharacterized protein N7457_006344 [Penicillium paradoxum]KAJ5781184.1 hypothetical protein N7457_006344 [Penicillium paradoxum]
MSHLSNVPSLLDFLPVAPSIRAEAEALLTNFTALPEDDKSSARAALLAAIFPLVFGDNALVEGSPTYEESRSQAWSTNCWLSPKVIVTPSNAAEVSQILALIRFVGATFSIRSGGHLQNPGFTSNDGGVVISLNRFTQLDLSDDKKTVKVGPGHRWLDVYKGLDVHGVTVAGGRVPHVGVPGLLLGGGLSFQNSEHALGCMNIVDYEVVLADSSIVHANATENKDLFWALKGGGTNYGIVTTLTMNTLPNNIWAEARVYPATASTQLHEALMVYHELIETDNKATLIWHTINQTTLVIFFYCAPIEKPDVFAPFYDIPFLMNIVPPAKRTVFEMVEAVSNVLSAEQLNHDMRTTTTLPSLTVYEAAEKARLEEMAALSDLERADLTMVIQPMSSLAIKVGEEKGGNPLGLKSVGHQWFLVMADYLNIADEERVRASVKKIVDVVEETAKKENAWLPFKYSNYSSRDQDPLASYGEENLAALREIAAKYDPEEVFQVLQNGGWLLSRAGKN